MRYVVTQGGFIVDRFDTYVNAEARAREEARDYDERAFVKTDEGRVLAEVPAGGSEVVERPRAEDEDEDEPTTQYSGGDVGPTAGQSWP